MAKARKVRTKARRVLYLLLFLFAQPTEVTLYVGIPMIALGQLINTITYGILQKRDSLITHGPYAWCRNPFYVGTLLSDFGFCAVANPTTIPVAAITIGYAVVQGTFFYLQILREERLLLALHGEAYKDYCNRVKWRLLPSPVSALKNGGFRLNWSAKLALHNRIFSRVVSAGFWICVFWAAKEMTFSTNSRVIDARVDLNAAVYNKYLVITASALAIFYYILRLMESRERRRQEKEDTRLTVTPSMKVDED